MSTQPTQTDTTLLLTLTGSCFAIISALVGVLYNRLNKDREGQQDQLDDGQKTFTLVRERLTALETKCGACEGIDKKDTAEILRISAELSRLHDDVVRIMVRDSTSP